MASLKAARTFQGPLITLRGLCELEDRAPTFSLRDVVSADGLRQFSGRVSAGDVDATWEMSVWGNGAWSAKADFHDGGVVAGDFFFLELLLDANHAVGAKLEGSILNLLDNRHLSLRKDGADRWIRENWHRIEGVGPSVRLHAAPAVGQLVATPIVLLASVPFVVVLAGFIILIGGAAAAAAASGKNVTVSRCPDQPFNADNTCVRFSVEPPTAGPGPP